ncbi:unnamed protein product [Rotaria socialis]|uniref:Uncharacterized protein n=1 Tax=Rotaria socialis TaxID=392032 RepID=A0A818U717_9BILA|nr:unnamed protein product [Rotaria socialis]CAF3693778.1 unnamed protein product [Rotaria socialis]CAF4222324.1 unnamed protein product [Rotaria socialis]CAF4352162.1 unnamed protein product [Rotaria socialis]
MPFVVQDVLQFKRTERQIRENHEREYSKYISTVRQQVLSTNVYYLSDEHVKEVELSRLRFSFEKKKQYERIKRENNVLSERLYAARKRAMVDDKNQTYKKNLDIFNAKYSQQRIIDYKRINNENDALMKRFNNVTTNLVDRNQCDQQWRKHIEIMKKSCEYPDKLERFVSSGNKHRPKQKCDWDKRYAVMLRNSSQSTENPLNLLMQLSE